jgi:hypothetical protein
MDLNFLLLFPQPVFRPLPPFPSPYRNLSQSRLKVGLDIGGRDGALILVVGLPDGDFEASAVGDGEFVGNKLDEGDTDEVGTSVSTIIGSVGKAVGFEVGKLDGKLVTNVGGSVGASLGPSVNTI